MSIQTPEQADKLIEKWIEPNPQRPGAADARLKEYGVPVWALIGHLEVVNGDITQVTRDSIFRVRQSTPRSPIMIGTKLSLMPESLLTQRSPVWLPFISTTRLLHRSRDCRNPIERFRAL